MGSTAEQKVAAAVEAAGRDLPELKKCMEELENARLDFDSYR